VQPVKTTPVEKISSSYISVAEAKIESLLVNSINQRVKGQSTDTINVRVIGVSMDETDQPLSQSDLTRANTSIGTVFNNFIKQSSFSKASLNVSSEGVYQIGGGVCEKSNYGEKLNTIIDGALQAAALSKPFNNYEMFAIIHPLPNCGVQFSHSGQSFKSYPYGENGASVELRGVQILSSAVGDSFIFKHEFGHSLGNLGHTGYYKCSVSDSGNETHVNIHDTCETTLEWPPYDLMSPYARGAKDYTALQKQVYGWLNDDNFVVTGDGTYKLTDIEQNDAGLKGIRVPIPNTRFVVSLEFIGSEQAVIPYALDTRSLTMNFLGTNELSLHEPLKQGRLYTFGNAKVSIRVDSISSGSATVTVRSN